MARPASRTILVVDDEASVRELLVSYLEHAYAPRGYVIESAASGADALAVVRARRPALVLLDIEMPGMDGAAALRGIRAIDPRIPVIMVTGNASTRIAGEVITDGAYAYLPKPVKLRYLDHLVGAVLRLA